MQVAFVQLFDPQATDRARDHQLLDLFGPSIAQQKAKLLA
jgi:hypothetical protein